MPRGPRALCPVEIRSSAHGARARWRTWRCCVCGQRGASSTPHRWTRIFFNDTAPGRRLRLRAVVMAIPSKSCGAWPARALPRGEPADRPQSTRALADLALLCLRPTRDALHSTPLAEALLHRHRNRSAATTLELSYHSFRVPWRAARARFAPWRTGRPPPRSTRALADLALLSSRPTRGELHPTSLDEDFL